MPKRVRYDVLVVDRSTLARNLYQILFSNQDRFRIDFANEFTSLAKRSPRFKPDLLLVNSNAIGRGETPMFPCPTILIISKDRLDLKESLDESRKLFILEKPFYPYDLLSVASRMVREKREAAPRGRPPGRKKR